MSYDAKAAELGLELPAAARPVANYVPAVRTGNLFSSRATVPSATAPWCGASSVRTWASKRELRPPASR